MSEKKKPSPSPSVREEIHSIIFGAESFYGRLFDVLLLIAILMSVGGACLHTVDSINAKWGPFLSKLEWFFTILFTIEYLFRLYCVKHPLKYAFSFWGIIDLLAFLPSYLGLFLRGTPSFVVVRSFRLLRVFRIMKLSWLTSESDELGRAVFNARAKIVVFLFVVLIAVTIAGSLMYEIENRNYGANFLAEVEVGGIERAEKIVDYQAMLQKDGLTVEDLAPLGESKFTSIPQAMYWATVTMTTVGYGDIVPTTVAGKILASALILLGYSLIIVPTGFVSAEFMKAHIKPVSNRACAHCLTEGHDRTAVFCNRCGERLSTTDSAVGED